MWFSNAGQVSDVNDGFNQYNLNLLAVNVALGLSYDPTHGTLTYIISISGPNAGLAISGYPTNTVSTSPKDAGLLQDIFDGATTTTYAPSGPTVYDATSGFDPSSADFSNPKGTIINCSDGIVIVNPDGSVIVIKTGT